MITEAILNGFATVVQFMLNLLPNIPQMPSGISSAISTITTLISQTVGVISYIYTPLVLVFVMTLFMAVLAFDNIYKFALWVYHKIRG